jgi:hypothetical protein
MATTVNVIQAGLVKTVTMTLMNVIQTLVAILAPVLTPSMASIVSVRRVLQVWMSFMWWFKLLVLEVLEFKHLWCDDGSVSLVSTILKDLFAFVCSGSQS